MSINSVKTKQLLIINEDDQFNEICIEEDNTSKASQSYMSEHINFQEWNEEYNDDKSSMSIASGNCVQNFLFDEIMGSNLIYN